MPRVRARNPRLRRRQLDLDVMAALDSPAIGTGSGIDRSLRRIYAELREEILAVVTVDETGPAMFWGYESGIPARLRRATEPDIRLAATGRADDAAAYAAAAAQHREIMSRRRAWLDQYHRRGGSPYNA